MIEYPLPPCERCGQAITEHEQKRCLDLWIHEQIFGKRSESHRYGPCPTCNYSGLYSRTPYYSEHIAAAWLIAERMRGLGWLVEVRIIPEEFLWHAEDHVASDRKALCMMQYMDLTTKAGAQLRMNSPTVFANSEALAVCRAALMAHYAQVHFTSHREET